MNWLITGGCGFIGRNLLKALLSEEGNYIRVIDNLSTGTRKDLAGICNFQESKTVSAPIDNRVDFYYLDILDEKAAIEVSKDIDVIVHLAANTGVGPSVAHPRNDCLNNVIGTLNYLEAARINDVKRFVFASSGAPAGECDPPIHEELPPHPVSPYGASKLAGEGYCSAYYRTFGIETIALRFSNVYGPLSAKKSSVVAKFIKRIIEGRPIEIYGDGGQTRDFIYIDDLVRALYLAATTPKIGGEIFQIATAQETTVDELSRILISLFEELGWKKEIPISYSDIRLGDVRRNFSDISKAKTMLKWQPQTTLKDGLRKTIDWYQLKNRFFHSGDPLGFMATNKLRISEKFWPSTFNDSI